MTRKKLNPTHQQIVQRDVETTPRTKRRQQLLICAITAHRTSPCEHEPKTAEDPIKQSVQHHVEDEKHGNVEPETDHSPNRPQQKPETESRAIDAIDCHFLKMFNLLGMLTADE